MTDIDLRLLKEEEKGEKATHTASLLPYDQMVVAYWTDLDNERDHVPRLICIKSMQWKQWQTILARAEAEPARRIHFGYDCNELSTSARRVIMKTTIFADANLVSAMSLLGDSLFSHRDMFAAILVDDDDERDENDDDGMNALNYLEMAARDARASSLYQHTRVRRARWMTRDDDEKHQGEERVGAPKRQGMPYTFLSL